MNRQSSRRIAHSPSPFPRSIQDQVDNLTVGAADFGFGYE